MLQLHLFFFAPAPTQPPQNIEVTSAGPGELIVTWEVRFK